MLHNINNRRGFTIIELIVSVAIMGIVSISSVKLLWDTLAAKSKQESIETSSNSFRNFISTLTKEIQSSQTAAILSPSSLKIINNPCRIIRLNPSFGGTIEQAIDNTVPCDPDPNNVFFEPILPNEIKVSQLVFSSNENPPKAIKIIVIGEYKDSVTNRQFNYSTTISIRNIL